MPAQDDTGAENPPGPADHASGNRITAWWNGKSGLQKILFCAGLVVAAVAAWHFHSQHKDSSREADISSEVKESMQHTFETDPQFAKYHLVVSKVDVMHKSGNDYEGMAVVHSPKAVDLLVGAVVVEAPNRSDHGRGRATDETALLKQLRINRPTASTRSLGLMFRHLQRPLETAGGSVAEPSQPAADEFGQVGAVHLGEAAEFLLA